MNWGAKQPYGSTLCDLNPTKIKKGKNDPTPKNEVVFLTVFELFLLNIHF